MKNLRTRSCALLCSSALLALACSTALAADPGGSRSSRTVYQQRQPDGSLLLSDRVPYGAEGNVLEQTWAFPVEDPARGAARRAELRTEYEAVTERVQRMIAQQDRLATELAVERMRLAAAQAWQEAEQAYSPYYRGSFARVPFGSPWQAPRP